MNNTNGLPPERAEQASAATSAEDGLHDHQNLEGPLASAFPIRPLETLKSCFDVCEDDTNTTGPNWKNGRVKFRYIFPPQKSSQVDDLDAGQYNGDIIERSSSIPKNIHALGCQKFLSDSLLREHVLSPYKHIARNGER